MNFMKDWMDNLTTSSSFGHAIRSLFHHNSYFELLGVTCYQTSSSKCITFCPPPLGVWKCMTCWQNMLVWRLIHSLAIAKIFILLKRIHLWLQIVLFENSIMKIKIFIIHILIFIKKRKQKPLRFFCDSRSTISAIACCLLQQLVDILKFV